MTRIIFQSKTGSDGVLHLDIPLGEPNVSYEVELVVHPSDAGKLLPEDYFDLIGSASDEMIIAHPQPPLPPPITLE